MPKSLFSQTDKFPRRETVTAAKWWAGLIRRFKDQVITDKFLKSQSEVVTFQKAQLTITNSKIVAFERALTKGIDQRLNKHLDGTRVIVNTLPDLLLLMALDEAGFGAAGMFVFNSSSYSDIRPGLVVVCTGSHDKPGKEEVLWQA